MNNNLLTVLKEIVAKNGDSILSEPKRVSAFFADLARDEPKPQKNALVKCLELGFAQTLKNVPESERTNCKQQLAQKLHNEEGLDLGLCGETIELLAAVLFGEEQKKIFCKNCGKELQEGWKNCPYCSTMDERQQVGSAISSGLGSGGYGIEIIKPETAILSINTVDITAGCNECPFYEPFKKKGCKYYSCDISEAAGYDCGIKRTDPGYLNLRKKRKNQNDILIVICGILTVFYGLGILIFIIIKKKRRKKAKRRSPEETK